MLDEPAAEALVNFNAQIISIRIIELDITFGGSGQFHCSGKDFAQQRLHIPGACYTRTNSLKLCHSSKIVGHSRFGLFTFGDILRDADHPGWRSVFIIKRTSPHMKPGRFAIDTVDTIFHLKLRSLSDRPGKCRLPAFTVFLVDGPCQLFVGQVIPRQDTEIRFTGIGRNQHIGCKIYLPGTQSPCFKRYLQAFLRFTQSLFSLHTFDQIGSLACKYIQKVEVMFRRFMGFVPLRGDHPQYPSIARNERSGLYGTDADLKVGCQIFRACHKIAFFDVRYDYPFPGLQGKSTGTIRIRRHPFPEFRGIRMESAEGQQTEFSFLSSLRIKHLDTGMFRMHNRSGGIDELFIQVFNIFFFNDPGTDVLQGLVTD